MEKNQKEHRIYIFTGKGGVGKSSVAAAHAVKSAKEGSHTLLVSTDVAHNLGDIFEVTAGREPTNVMEHLDLYELSPDYVMEHDFPDFVGFLNRLIPNGTGEGMEDFGMIPGMEELFSLLKIADLYQEKRYDRIMVDCAPTGETLSLLKFPELLSWYMEKLFPVGKVAVRLLAPVSKQFFKVELPNKTAMNDIERMYVKLIYLQELLKNREITSVRLVTMPEKMVVEETKRNYMYLNLYNFNVDGLYINRILPEDIQNSFFDEWLRVQSYYIGQLEQSFPSLPIYKIPWYDKELKGVPAVERICREDLKDPELFAVKTITEREMFEKNEEGYVLTVYLPYAGKEDLELYQAPEDVVLRLGNFKRNIPLPNSLSHYDISSAELKDGRLRVQFVRDAAANKVD